MESHCIVPVPVRLVLIFSSLLEAGIVLDLRSNLAKSSFSVFCADVSMLDFAARSYSKSRYSKSLLVRSYQQQSYVDKREKR